MKALVSSDWHADARTIGVPRFEDIEKAVNTTVEVAIAQKVDAYFFPGDLTDPDSGVSVFRSVGLAITTAIRLAKADIRSFWLPGNHDVIEDGSGETTLTPMRGLGNPYITLMEKPGRYQIASRNGGGQSMRIIALPFTPTSHAYDPEKIVAPALGLDGINIVIAHLSVPGVQPGEETTEMPRGRDVVFPHHLFPSSMDGRTLLIQGHYHRQQTYRAPGLCPIFIPGSVERLTFSEEKHEPGYLLVDI